MANLENQWLANFNFRRKSSRKPKHTSVVRKRVSPSLPLSMCSVSPSLPLSMCSVSTSLPLSMRKSSVKRVSPSLPLSMRKNSVKRGATRRVAGSRKVKRSAMKFAFF